VRLADPLLVQAPTQCPRAPIKLLTLIDYDKSGVINDYEECMSLPKYNLTRRDSMGKLLH